MSFRERYRQELQPLRPVMLDLLGAMATWWDSSRSHQRLVMAYERLMATVGEVEEAIEELLASEEDNDITLTKPYSLKPSRLKLN